MPGYNPVRQSISSVENIHQERHGGDANAMYRFREPIRWYLLIIMLYTFGAIALLVWTLSGPSLSGARWILRTGSIKVDQLYSGLFLSIVLAPIAIITRRMSNDFGLLHPLAIATSYPVRVTDLVKMADPGLFAVLANFRYSSWRGMMLSFLMLAGAFLVPIGTLTITTGTYKPQTLHNSTVGLPARFSEMVTSTMSHSMGYSGTGQFVPTYGSNDFFLAMIVDSFKGSIISKRGLVESNPGDIGPASTLNITFETGVRYGGLVTYHWNSSCEPAKNDIQYSIQREAGVPYVSFTFPDGTINRSDEARLPVFLWSNGTSKTANGIPIGGSLFIAMTSELLPTSVITDNSSLTIVNNIWIARIKCTPAFHWRISSCTYDNNQMGNCTATPGANTTQLDTTGLNALSGYMTAVPWLLYLRNDYIWNVTLIPIYTIPTVNQVTSILGMLAQSLASVSTAGYYGTATVPAVGEPPKPVYIVRVYILGLVLGIFVAVTVLSMADIIYHIAKHLPFRRLTFLSIANAVRGRWWDKELSGGCVLSDNEMSALCGSSTVQFGVDFNNTEHVGLAPRVLKIQEHVAYYGLRRRAS
ncbi:hypothetical protein RAB80_003785 [Fusarium oxysporum f. sp. vasinfectum]|nr:hypothetical protein RAB80_003785 [Fusarium oxysporum f. sp. vasinfectum]